VILKVAKTIADRGDIIPARVVIAHAWTAAAWHKTLHALSAAEPGLLSEIAAEVTTN